MAERTKINAYFAYSFIVGALIYPIYGHWAWSESGWLTYMGFADYAGSGVVHMIGGFLALAGANGRRSAQGLGAGHHYTRA